MILIKKNSENILDPKLYSTARKKAAHRSVVELMNWTDLTITQIGRNLDEYRKSGDRTCLDEMKYGLTTMLAVIDMLNIDIEARSAILE